MKQILRVVSLLIVLAGTGIAAAHAAETDQARAFVERLGNETVEVLRSGTSPEQREERLQDIFRRGFALDFIGRFVLGRAWNQATPQQRQDYQQAFADFVVQSYARRLRDEKVSGFTIDSVRDAGDHDVLVQTTIERPHGPPLAYGWRIRPMGQDHKIIDITVENVSLVVTQRSEFASVVQRQGMDGLIDALRKRTAPAG